MAWCAGLWAGRGWDIVIGAVVVVAGPVLVLCTIFIFLTAWLCLPAHHEAAFVLTTRQTMKVFACLISLAMFYASPSTPCFVSRQGRLRLHSQGFKVASGFSKSLSLTDLELAEQTQFAL